MVFCQAQENQAAKVYYVKGDLSPAALYGVKVNQLDSADYVRKVAPEKYNENLYDVTEFYLDKSKKNWQSLTNGFLLNSVIS